MNILFVSLLFLQSFAVLVLVLPFRYEMFIFLLKWFAENYCLN